MTMTATGRDERALRLGSQRVRVKISGEGRPVLLLNGVGAPLEIWQPLLRRLTGVRAISYDMPGSGGSAPPDLPLSVTGHARLALRLLDELGCGRASVLGFSFGGMVAQELARIAGHRLERLVLASTACGWGGVPGDPAALLSLTTPDRYYTRILQSAAADGLSSRRGSGSPPTWDLPPTSEAASSRGRVYQFWAAATWSSLWWLHQVRQPTLVLTGDRDRVVPPVNARLLARLLPNARLHVVRDAGHLCLIERAASVGPLLDEFLTAPAPAP